MPLPKPSESESQDDFMSRCMGDDKMVGEYPDEKQRAAVCHTQFGGKQNMSSKPWDVEIAATGVWNSSTAGKVEIKLEHLQEMVRAFHTLKDTVKPMLKLGHNNKQPLIAADDGQPALGWADNLRVVGNKLVATFKDVPAVLRKAIEAKRYARVSVEIQPNVKTKSGQFSHVLTAVSLLGADIPAINTLADLTTYMSHREFESDPIVFTYAKKESIMTEEELRLENAELKQQLADLKLSSGQEVQALTTKVTGLEAEVAAFTEKEQKAEAEKAKIEFTEKCETMVKAGAMSPAQRDQMTALYSEDKHETLMSQLDVFAAGSKIDFSEKGSNGGQQEETGERADARLARLANERASKDKIDFSSAMTLVLTEDRQLAAEYAMQNGEEG